MKVKAGSAGTSDSDMRKKITICFRTSEDLQEGLRRIGEHERRSVSSVIERALFEYVQGREQLKRVAGEKRRHPRKSLSVPALVRNADAGDQGLHAGLVVNISLGGLRISVPSAFPVELDEDRKQSKISVVFTLPDGKKPLTVECTPKHVLPHNGTTMIGAAFTNADFGSYQTLQEYLVN